MKKFIFTAAFCFVTLCRAEFLTLPVSLNNRAVYHIKAHQIDEFCCGYNALYNACNLEKVAHFPIVLVIIPFLKTPVCRY